MIKPGPFVGFIPVAPSEMFLSSQAKTCDPGLQIASLFKLKY